MSKYKRKLHLALGGGGARGLAHIGVLSAIEKENLPIARLSGTSGGAVIAALYAQTGNVQEVYHRMQRFLRCDDFKEFGVDLFREEEQRSEETYQQYIENMFNQLKARLTFTKIFITESIFRADRFVDLLSNLYDKQNIEDCRIPLQIAAVNVDTGEEVLLDKGDLIQAVAASSAIPGMIAPIEFNGMRLIDGAVLNAVPLSAADRSREVVIGVDVSRNIRHDYPHRLALDYIFRAEEITMFGLNQLHLQKAEILVQPEEARQGHWADFSRVEEFIKSGEKATAEKLPLIRKAMTYRDSRLKCWLKRKVCTG